MRNEHVRKISAAAKHRIYLRRRKLVDALKNRPCMDCGDWLEPFQMDFDHRPGTVKEFAIGTFAYATVPRILVEIAKCDVVCANCHRLRTHKRKQHYGSHDANGVPILKEKV